MTGWLDALIQGVLLGGLYALFAAGLSLIFGVMRLVNLAHGDLIVLAAFVILVVANRLGLDPFVAVLVALPILFVVGFALQYVLLNRTLGARSAAAAARHLRPVDHHPERAVADFFRRQPAPALGRDRDGLDPARRRHRGRRRAAADACCRRSP